VSNTRRKNILRIADERGRFMPATTMKLIVEVEPEAYGPLILTLTKTPGVIRFDADLGEGAGSVQRAKSNYKETALALFAKHNGGPLTLDDLARELGGPRQRSSGVVNQLRKENVLRIIGTATYQFTPRAMAAAGLTLALPKPDKPAKPKKQAAKPKHAAKTAKPEKKKRASPGAATAALQAVLADGPKQAGEIKIGLAKHGVSANSVSGVLERGVKSGVLKHVGKDYSLASRANGAAVAGV
jgi:hypothetical protein